MDGTKFWANVTKRMGYMRMSDLSKVTGIKSDNLRAMKRKGSIPKADQVYKMASAIGCSTEDFFSEEVVPV